MLHSCTRTMSAWGTVFFFQHHFGPTMETAFIQDLLDPGLVILCPPVQATQSPSGAGGGGRGGSRGGCGRLRGDHGLG